MKLLLFLAMALPSQPFASCFSQSSAFGSLVRGRTDHPIGPGRAQCPTELFASKVDRLPVAPELPGFPKKRLVGVMAQFRKDAAAAIQAHAQYCYEKNLPGVAMDVGVLGKFYLLVGPDQVQHVLEDRKNIYYKSALDRRGVGLLTGRGVLLSDGAEHTQKRRLILPAFDQKSLSNFVDIMVDAAETEAKSLLSLTANDSPAVFNVQKRMQSVAMKVVSLCLFSSDCSAGSDLDIQTCLDHVIYVSRHPFALPQWVPSRRNRRFKKAMRPLDDLVNGLIESGRQKKMVAEKPDLLSMLLSARYEEEDEDSSGTKQTKRLTDVELRDEIMTLFLAGHETTALTLSWALYFLSDPKHAHWQEAIAQEGRLLLDDCSPSMLMDPNALKHTRAVLCEALRLRPPSWAFDRQVQADTELPGGIRVRKGELLLISPLVMHRQEDYFANSLEFDPNRFLDKPVEGDAWDGQFSRSRYMPFGAGRKRCIGFRFAQWEMLVVLATIMRECTFSRIPGEETREMKGVPDVTLRLEEPFQLIVIPRDATSAPDKLVTIKEQRG